MNILFLYPYLNEEPDQNNTEVYEFYNCIKEMKNINLVNSYETADYVIYMMHYRNLLNLP